MRSKWWRSSPSPRRPASGTTGQPSSTPRLGRRAFLGVLGGGTLATLLPLRGGGGGLLPLTAEPAPALAAAPFRSQLPIPRVLDEDQIRIPIREAEQQILPGRPTRLWTFGGTFPGPTIRRRAGQRTRVTFEHRLGEAAGELSIHLHGGHNRSQFDGQPGGLTKRQPISYFCQIPRGLSARESGNDLLLEPGGEKTYVYDLVEDGKPERASFQWYHDHRLDRTAPNVWKGLAGMWIVDDGFEEALPLPRGDHDLPLMIGDRTFDRHNQLTDPFSDRRPPNDGILGEGVLVNGAFMPYRRVSARRYRLRFLNISSYRSYNLQLSNGAPMVQIATESGLMPRPIRRREILLGPGERVEVIVDFAGMAGESVELRSSKRHAGRNSIGARTYGGALMQFRVAAERVPDRSRIPRQLRPLPAWTRKAKRTPDQRWEIAIGGFFKPTWRINGRTFNPARSEAFPRLGTTETWEIVNKTSVAHVMHLHHTDWYLLERNGSPPPPWEDCLKETFFVFPNEKILLAGHFCDHAGKFAVHCHMLDHEDHGLMSQFQVVRP
ncbi:MAG TPA: multicopper oxidase family protein [Solirubrobacterales bacterium]|nr:multicopper oxidase family protein [Solirubrobacterales bacterium]